MVQGHLITHGWWTAPQCFSSLKECSVFLSLICTRTCVCIWEGAVVPSGAGVCLAVSPCPAPCSRHSSTRPTDCCRGMRGGRWQGWSQRKAPGDACLPSGAMRCLVVELPQVEVGKGPSSCMGTCVCLSHHAWLRQIA